ncbi:hypothetical protein [Microbacterium laevaniformans]|uniref:hypothetical protein n=1 Tax=Microbacterium laevaniformans TaxID=36807 RepID=UPI003D9532D9
MRWWNELKPAHRLIVIPILAVAIGGPTLWLSQNSMIEFFASWVAMGAGVLLSGAFRTNSTTPFWHAVAENRGLHLALSGGVGLAVATVDSWGSALLPGLGPVASGVVVTLPVNFAAWLLIGRIFNPGLPILLRGVDWAWRIWDPRGLPREARFDVLVNALARAVVTCTFRIVAVLAVPFLVAEGQYPLLAGLIAAVVLVLLFGTFGPQTAKSSTGHVVGETTSGTEEETDG